jgi:hypothetical protein
MFYLGVGGTAFWFISCFMFSYSVAAPYQTAKENSEIQQP